MCVSQLVRFAGASSDLGGFDRRGGALAAGLLGRVCRCFGLRGAFSGFCRRHNALLEGCGVSLGALLQRGVSGPGFCGDLVCGFFCFFLVGGGGVVGGSGFSERFGEHVGSCRGVGCGLGVVRRAACLVVGPVIVGGYASLFNCTAAVRASDSVAVSS